jgi:hypothetical protein
VALGRQRIGDETSYLDVVFDQDDPGHFGRLSGVGGQNPGLDETLISR